MRSLRCPGSLHRLAATACVLLLATASVAAPPATEGDELERVTRGVESTLEQYTGADHVIVLLVTALLVLLAVGVHYEAMRLLVKLMKRLHTHRRLAIVGVMLGLVLAHLVEIHIFALAYAILEAMGGFGSIHGYSPIVGGVPDPAGVDYIYFSGIVYSTVGFGDLVPTGPLRLLAAVEALLGLMLVAWSASFTYLMMHSHWHESFESRLPVDPSHRASRA